MKIRYGFVSNSSSSSFVCPVCDALHSIMDGDPNNATDICICKNNHAFCFSHLRMSNDQLRQELYKINREHFEKDKIDEELYLYLNEGKVETWEIYDFIIDFIHEIPIEFCPICRLEEFQERELNAYIKKRIGGKEAIKDMIRREFNSYEEFTNFIKDEIKEEKNEDEEWIY